MNIRHVADDFHVTGQLGPNDMAGVAAAGYRTVICMRPDGEGWMQPKFSAIEDAARQNGLDARYLPVGGSHQPQEQAPKLSSMLKDAKGPVLAFCASGQRCAGLYQMARQLSG